jgi:hypothetical protein
VLLLFLDGFLPQQSEEERASNNNKEHDLNMTKPTTISGFMCAFLNHPCIAWLRALYELSALRLSLLGVVQTAAGVVQRHDAFATRQICQHRPR